MLTGREPRGDFWGISDVGFLDVGGGHLDVFTLGEFTELDSLSYTYVLYYTELKHCFVTKDAA